MMDEPRSIEEGYVYVDKVKEKWVIKDDAPDWAKEEFENLFNKSISDENEKIILR